MYIIFIWIVSFTPYLVESVQSLVWYSPLPQSQQFKAIQLSLSHTHTHTHTHHSRTHTRARALTHTAHMHAHTHTHTHMHWHTHALTHTHTHTHTHTDFCLGYLKHKPTNSYHSRKAGLETHLGGITRVTHTNYTHTHAERTEVRSQSYIYLRCLWVRYVVSMQRGVSFLLSQKHWVLSGR